jgi:hypothetical protein
VSLHGGHSGDFCEHGADSLREMLDAAVSFGYSTFGSLSMRIESKCCGALR